MNSVVGQTGLVGLDLSRVPPVRFVENVDKMLVQASIVNAALAHSTWMRRCTSCTTVGHGVVGGIVSIDAEQFWCEYNRSVECSAHEADRAILQVAGVSLSVDSTTSRDSSHQRQ